jgi:hypothetical protein
MMRSIQAVCAYFLVGAAFMVALVQLALVLERAL